jgi:hypothetical protein
MYAHILQHMYAHILQHIVNAASLHILICILFVRITHLRQIIVHLELLYLDVINPLGTMEYS